DDLRRSPVAPLPARRARRYAGARRSPFRRGVMVRGAGGGGGARQLLRGAEDVPTGVSKVLLTCVAADGRGRRRELVVVDARWPGERRRHVTASRNLRAFFSSAEGRGLSAGGPAFMEANRPKTALRSTVASTSAVSWRRWSVESCPSILAPATAWW
ncbi:unnamed protein product, partial [Ectocarpus sp. 12 AP-2014]